MSGESASQTKITLSELLSPDMISKLYEYQQGLVWNSINNILPREVNESLSSEREKTAFFADVAIALDSLEAKHVESETSILKLFEDDPWLHQWQITLDNFVEKNKATFLRGHAEEDRKIIERDIIRAILMRKLTLLALNESVIIEEKDQIS